MQMPNAVPLCPPRNKPFRSIPSTTPKYDNRLTIRLLESGAGTFTTELLGLATSGIGDEQGAVKLDKGGLEQILGVLIDVLGEVGNLQRVISC